MRVCPSGERHGSITWPMANQWRTAGAPGQSGNPLGRPKGSRNRLGEQFVADLYSDWQAHGADVIRRVREERPDQYLKVVVSVLPKELHVKEQPLEEFSDEELLEF